MRNMRRPSTITPSPKVITAADFRALWDATTPDPAGYRARAILCLLADSGVRAGGLLSMNLTTTFLNNCTALVREKGGRRRTIIFGQLTRDHIRAWLAARPHTAEPLFTSLKSPSRLTSSGLAQLLERLKIRAGVSGAVNPHSFRHTFAKEYLSRGGDLVTLRDLLGHSEITTTANYYAVFHHSEAASRHALYSPLSAWLSPNATSPTPTINQKDED
jgi:integrase/recombinase XerD